MFLRAFIALSLIFMTALPAGAAKFFLSAAGMRGSFVATVVDCESGDVKDTLVGVRNDERAVVVGPVAFQGWDGLCIQGVYETLGPDYVLGALTLQSESGPVFVLPDLRGGLDEVRMIDPEAAQAVAAVENAYPNFEWGVCDHQDRYMNPPAACAEMDQAKQGIRADILSFRFPLTRSRPVEIPAWSGMARLTVTLEDGTEVWAINADSWPGGVLPVPADSGGWISIRFYEPGVFDGAQYGVSGGRSWAFSPQTVGEAVTFKDDPEYLLIDVRIPEPETRRYALYAHNQSTLLHYGPQGWQMDAYGWPILFNLSGRHEFYLPKDAADSGLAKALGDGVYKLGVIGDGNYYITDVLWGDLQRTDLPASIGGENGNARFLLALVDRMLVEIYAKDGDNWTTVSDYQEDLGNLKVVEFEGAGTNAVARRWPDGSTRLILVGLFLDDTEENNDADDDETIQVDPPDFFPTAAIDCGEDWTGTMTLRNGDEFDTPSGHKAYLFWEHIDIAKFDKTLHCTYTIHAKGREVVNGELDIPPDTVAIDQDSSGFDVTMESVYAPVLYGDVRVCFKDENARKRGVSVRVYVDRTNDWVFTEQYELPWDDDRCASGRIVLIGDETGDQELSDRVNVIIGAYQHEFLLSEYPSGSAYTVHVPAGGYPATGIVNVSDQALSPTVRKLMLDVTAKMGPSRSIGADEIYVYLGIQKPGMGYLYVTNDGLDASSERLPLTVIHGGRNGASLERSISARLDFGNFFGFRFPGIYRAILELEAGGQVFYAAEETFEIRP